MAISVQVAIIHLLLALNDLEDDKKFEWYEH